MTYPRKIKIENEKLKQLLAEKDTLVMQGRKLNETIETYVENMKEVENKLIEEEKKVDISIFATEAEECTNEMNALMAKMQAVQKKMFDYIRENTPQELRTEYEVIEKKIADKTAILRTECFTETIVLNVTNILYDEVSHVDLNLPKNKEIDQRIVFSELISTVRNLVKSNTELKLELFNVKEKLEKREVEELKDTKPKFIKNQEETVS